MILLSHFSKKKFPSSIPQSGFRALQGLQLRSYGIVRRHEEATTLHLQSASFRIYADIKLDEI
jgi:hypothetical protein